MVAAITSDRMTPDHPRWPEFIERLKGVEGVRFLYDEMGNADIEHTACDGETLTRSARILASMPGIEVEASLEWLKDQGLFCDCGVVLMFANVQQQALPWKLSLNWHRGV